MALLFSLLKEVIQSLCLSQLFSLWLCRQITKVLQNIGKNCIKNLSLFDEIKPGCDLFTLS